MSKIKIFIILIPVIVGAFFFIYLFFINQDLNKRGLLCGNQKLIFAKTQSEYFPALYLRNEESPILVNTNKEFVVLEEKTKKLISKKVAFTKVGKALFSPEIWINGIVKDSQDNLYNLTVKFKTVKNSDNCFFEGNLFVKNLGPHENKNIRILLNFSVENKKSDPYLFSPGIFYGNNDPLGIGEDYMNIPNFKILQKDKIFTFLGNRPMLPISAIYQNNIAFTLATEEHSQIGDNNLRNSLGWQLGKNEISLSSWTHGYIFRRYDGPGTWKNVDNVSSKIKGLPVNQILEKKFYLQASRGEVGELFKHYQILRDYYRKDLPQLTYEDMLSSFNTKNSALPNFYESEDNYFYQVAYHPENVVNSWVGGTPAGYGILRIGQILNEETLVVKARKFIDFLVKDSLSPSGFYYPYYDRENNLWSTDGWWKGPYLKEIPSRMASESTFYLLKACLDEKQNNINHPDWENTAISNLDAITNVWENFQDFGYSLNEKEPGLEKKGTSSGILWLGALALGYDLTGNKKYLNVTEQAAEIYYQKYIRLGLLYGAELDQGFAPDASTAAHAFTAYTVLYETTKKEKYLKYAKESANIYATYIFGYNTDFLPKSEAGKKKWTSLGMSTSGAKNNHITSGCWPGFVEYLVKLYDYSKDIYYLNLASDQYRAALEGYSRSDYDFGNIPGMSKVIKGFGFDWILHSDWGGERVWFGGVMHTGMLHQIYIPGANWPNSFKDYGDAIIDYKSKKAVNLNSYEVNTTFLPGNNIYLKLNNRTEDKPVKIYLSNFPAGHYRFIQNLLNIKNIEIRNNEKNYILL